MKFILLVALLFTSLSAAATLQSRAVCSGATKCTLAQAKSALQGAGIKHYSTGKDSSGNSCYTRTRTDCTGYEQLRRNTVEMAITLKKACDCELIITGGTEKGHASGEKSHWNGYKLDIRHNKKLDAYVKGTFTRIANRGSYPQWKSKAGNIYCDEGDHWDVVFV